MRILEVTTGPSQYDFHNLKGKKPSPHFGNINTDKKIINYIRTNCSEMVDAYKATGKMLYRGLNGVKPNFVMATIRPDRKPLQMGEYAHDFLNKVFTYLKIKPNRGNSIFCSTNPGVAGDWSGDYMTPFCIFVKNGWTGLVFEAIKNDYAYYQLKDIANSFRYAGHDPDGTDLAGAARQVKQLRPFQFNNSAGLQKVLNEEYMDIIITGSDYIGIRTNDIDYIWSQLAGE